MKTLDEHNNETWQYFSNQNKSVGAGVACPKCGTEMLITDTGTVLLTWPPKRSVECPSCKHHDYML